MSTRATRAITASRASSLELAPKTNRRMGASRRERREDFMNNQISRRDVIAKLGTAAGVAVFGPRGARAQQAAPARTAPPTVISSPPRDFTPGAAPVSY